MNLKDIVNMDDQSILDWIENRNQIRKEAYLPLIQVEKEFCRVKELRDGIKRAREFSKFADPLRQRVRDEVLAEMRRERDNPDWVPTGILSGGRYLYEIRVQKELCRLYNNQKDL
jgi:hypothetical protein